MKKWEYEDFDSDSYDLRRKLNDIGRDGWEVFHIEKYHHQEQDYEESYTRTSYTIYAKREVEQN